MTTLTKISDLSELEKEERQTVLAYDTVIAFENNDLGTFNRKVAEIAELRGEPVQVVRHEVCKGIFKRMKVVGNKWLIEVY